MIPLLDLGFKTHTEHPREAHFERAMNYCRNLLCTAFCVISTTLSGQGIDYEKLLYDLTARTIQGHDSSKNEIKLVRFAAIPSEIWDNQKKSPKTGSYFTETDLESISRQIENPIIKTWDADPIRKLRYVKLISKPRGHNSLLISLPIISQDGLTIVMYYQVLDKRASAGFVTVWRKTQEGNWKVEKRDMLWITKLRVPAHNIAYTSSPVFALQLNTKLRFDALTPEIASTRWSC